MDTSTLTIFFGRPKLDEIHDSEEIRTYKDVWSGDRYRVELRQFFDSPSVIGIDIKTDGFDIFGLRSTTTFNQWPVIVTCTSLPPEVRFQKANMLKVVLIPGPNIPVNIDSFIRPFIEELVRLRKGVTGIFNAHLSKLPFFSANIKLLTSDRQRPGGYGEGNRDGHHRGHAGSGETGPSTRQSGKAV